jgi:hypothetical protein
MPPPLGALAVGSDCNSPFIVSVNLKPSFLTPRSMGRESPPIVFSPTQWLLDALLLLLAHGKPGCRMVRASMADRHPLIFWAMCGITLSARMSATNEAAS